MALERVVTIGAYGFTAESFLAALRDADVDTFLDIRQRRGVRGAEYAFANRGRLTATLDSMGIYYRHELGLAPTTVAISWRLQLPDEMSKSRSQVTPV